MYPDGLVIGKEIPRKMFKSEPLENFSMRSFAANRSIPIYLPGDEQGDQKLIVLQVQGQNAADPLRYLISHKTPLRGLMLDFCDRAGLVFECTRFLEPEGSLINPDRTADDLNLENEDTIDAMNYQLGGFVN